VLDRQQRSGSAWGDGQPLYTLLGADRKPYQSTVKGILGGHRRDRIYGRLDCPAAAQALRTGGYRSERVFFADLETAVAAGFRPCAACLPERYAAWKSSQRSTSTPLLPSRAA